MSPVIIDDVMVLYVVMCDVSLETRENTWKMRVSGNNETNNGTILINIVK